MNKSTALMTACLSLSLGAFGDWIPTDAGEYDYNEASNWDGNTPNGKFSRALNGDQTIKIADGTEINGGLTIGYSGDHALTFVSDGTGPSTVTLKGNVSLSVAGNGKNAHVTFGSATAADNLVLDLDGTMRMFIVTASDNNPSNIGHLNLYATLANGSVYYSGKGTVKIYGANTYADGTTFMNSGYVYLNSDAALGTGLALVGTDGPHFHCDGGGVLIANEWVMAGDFSFHGASITWAGTMTIPAPIKFWCESDGLTIASPAIVDNDGNCAVANFVKYGSKSVRVDTPFELDDTTVSVKNGTWNQFGELSGSGLTISGSTDGSQHFHMCAPGDLDGTIEFTEGNVSVYLDNSQPVATTAVFKFGPSCTLAVNQASAEDLLARGQVDPSSSGVLALGANVSGTLDLSKTPLVSIGAAGSDRTISGSIVPAPGGVMRLGGGGKSLVLSGENVLPEDGRLELRGNVILTAANVFAGDVKVYSGTLELKGDAGSLPNAEVEVYGAKVYFNSNGSTGAKRAGTVHLHGGTLQLNGNDKHATTDSIDKLIVDVRDPLPGAVGGVCHLSLNAYGKTAAFNVGELERRNDMLFRIQGQANGKALRVGGTNENTVVFKVGNADEIAGALVGGGGEAGSKTVSVYPFSFIDNGTYNDSLTTYDANGFRGLDIDTEYVTNVTAETSAMANVRLPVGSTTEITAETTFNSVFLQGSDPNKGSTYLTGEGKLKVTSGVVVLGYHRNAKPYVQCPVDFGARQGVICFGRGKGSSWDGPIHGTAGAIFFQTSGDAATDSGGTGLQVSAGAAGASTITGDIVVHGYLSSGAANFVPGDGDRRGDMRVYGYASMAGQTFDGVFGAGYFYRSGSTLTIGNHDADGDFDGAFISDTAIVKTGTGRQRVGGDCTHSRATTVNAGVLQFDGAVSASATTVKSGATLAGSGDWAKGVTLEADTTLEAGSTKSDDHTMSFAGGLTLNGATTLNLVAKDRKTIGCVDVSGDLSIPSGAVIPVNVLLADGLKLKKGITHVIFRSATPLNAKNFARGANCGPLRLSADGTELMMTVNNGIKIVVR